MSISIFIIFLFLFQISHTLFVPSQHISERKTSTEKCVEKISRRMSSVCGPEYFKENFVFPQDLIVFFNFLSDCCGKGCSDQNILKFCETLVSRT